jgi:hypothetical protein
MSVCILVVLSMEDQRLFIDDSPRLVFSIQSPYDLFFLRMPLVSNGLQLIQKYKLLGMYVEQFDRILTF